MNTLVSIPRPEIQRIAFISDPEIAGRAFVELRDSVKATCGIKLEAVYLPSYAAMFQALENEPTLLAWAPPLVAADLVDAQTAAPLVTAKRCGATNYQSALVALPTSHIDDVWDLPGASVGWVSKLSAAGYVVPRFFLHSLGFDVDRIFRSERFLRSHDRAAQALHVGEVDVIATHARWDPMIRSFVLPTRVIGARILAMTGPIPADVILAGTRMVASRFETLRSALMTLCVPKNGRLAQLMGVDSFELACARHFEPLRRWRPRLSDTAVESCQFAVPA